MTWRFTRFIEAVALLLLLAAAAASAQERRYVRSVVQYAPPDVTLTDARGERVRMAEVLDAPGPVLLQFIFTTCPAVCPTLSASLSGLQGETVRRVSISIDPEIDTPARLRDYADRFKTGPDWWLLTGSREDVDAVRKAFDAWSVNKMSHEPLTFLRPSSGQPWVRLAGLLSAAELSAEIRGGLAAPQPDPELGRLIYLDSCASCHRRSGFGMSEGGVYVPRVTGPALFQPRQLVRADLFRSLYQETQPMPYNARVRDPRLRPAYTPETLAAAVREGRDPVGRMLDPVMPRYRLSDLSDEEMGHLTAYLQGLSAVPSPGVDGETIHFATVITDGVDPARRKAMLDVLEAYVRWKNAETKHSAARLGFSPWYRDEFHGSLREWKLHVWDLHGPARTWPAQLAAYSRAQPVFALLSGLGKGSWQPVHDFCEQAEVPCLFPNTDLPAVSPPGAYALYLSPGLSVEAQALARQFKESKGRIVQVYRDTDEGRVPAQVLRDELGTVEDRAIAPGEALTAAFWRRLVRETRPAVLVLWLGPEDAATLGPAADALDPIRQVVFSGSLFEEALEDVSNVPAALRERAWLTWPFALPGHEEPLVYRVRAWMRARRVETSHERLQLNTWFALAVADHALAHLVENFSRDFFVESVEEETENALSPGVFPSLSLGPSQRFASKGCYVVKPAPGGWEAVGGWTVP